MTVGHPTTRPWMPLQSSPRRWNGVPKVMFSSMGGSFHCISFRLGHFILPEVGVTVQPKQPLVPPECPRGGSHHLLGGISLSEGCACSCHRGMTLECPNSKNGDSLRGDGGGWHTLPPGQNYPHLLYVQCFHVSELFYFIMSHRLHTSRWSTA